MPARGYKFSPEQRADQLAKRVETMRKNGTRPGAPKGTPCPESTKQALREHARGPGATPWSICEECGKEYPYKWGGKQRFCSRACGGKQRRSEGGRSKNLDGYVLIRQPYGSKPVYKMEHRIVMEQHLGRVLTAKENVHHKNGVRGDNRIENLELWGVTQPSGQRLTEQKHCPTCTCCEKREDA